MTSMSTRFTGVVALRGGGASTQQPRDQRSPLSRAVGLGVRGSLALPGAVDCMRWWRSRDIQWSFYIVLGEAQLFVGHIEGIWTWLWSASLL